MFEPPLLNAIYNGNMSSARKLIELGTDVNISNHSSQDTAIHLAVSAARFEILQLLIDKGADYTAKNVHGRNILHMTARMGGAKTVAALAKASVVGLDTTLKDNEGKTVHDYLAEREILLDSEVGLHSNFERLLASISLKTLPSVAPMVPTGSGGVTCNLEFQRGPKPRHSFPDAYFMINEEL